jgi:hypothetical protein
MQGVRHEMSRALVSADSPVQRSNRWLLWGAALLVLLFAFIAWRVFKPSPAASATGAIEQITADGLAERYGLRVRLIGVTAGGGMVDFRLKVLDAVKAKPLLLDAERRPSLIVEKSGATLTSPGSADADLLIEDGGIIFTLFPNSGGAIRPGDKVIVAFGDLRLEPVAAQ